MLVTPKLRIRRSEHSTPGRLLCETVHAGRGNDQTSLQANFTSLTNDLLAVQRHGIGQTGKTFVRFELYWF